MGADLAKDFGFLPSSWTVISPSLPAAVASNVQVAWATNEPPAGDDATTGWPNNTPAALSPNGAIVYASVAKQVDNADEYVELSPPLTLGVGEFFTEYEDQPAPNVSSIRISAQVSGAYVLVYVYFGSPSPAPAVRQDAEAQLARLMLPQAVAHP